MLKKFCALLIIMAMGMILLVGCEPKQNEREPDNTRIVAAYAALNEYVADLQQAAGSAYQKIQAQLSQKLPAVEGEAARPLLNERFVQEVLAELRSKAPVTSWCWQNPQGVIVISDLAQTLGQPGGANEIVNVAYQNNAVYASNNVVQRLEAAKALVIVIPVVDSDQVYGAFVGVVSPERDFGRVLAPNIDLPRGFVVMNLQGGIIFSDNLDEIGRNYLTDDYYKSFGDLLLVVNKMRSQESGMARYYFYVGNTPYKDWYNATWVSINYFSHVWRFIAREPISLDLQTTY